MAWIRRGQGVRTEMRLHEGSDMRGVRLRGAVFTRGRLRCLRVMERGSGEWEAAAERVDHGDETGISRGEGVRAPNAGEEMSQCRSRGSE